jgi:1,4-alpha-glucan branching enzyme
LGAGLAAGVVANSIARAEGGSQAVHAGGAGKSLPPSSPSWARHLIIYEIATKGFTSPGGPETGTFNSLKTKLPYLEELGITGIWLTGHSLADAHFFYNIWTQYANLEPDKIEPTLGTPEDFKSLIAEAHRHGIRVFLDVHTHGILSFSPLIQRQPHWFRGGIWHMTDYDWYGGHPDLDDWWVKTWTEYVTVYGADGFRLDYGILRPDLWARIRQNAARAGHEIVLFEEGDAPIPGVTDFNQHDNSFHVGLKGDLNKVLTENVPGLYDRKFGRTGAYRVEIQYADDGSRVEGDTQGRGDLRVHLDGLTADKIARRIDDDHADGIPDIQLTVENVAKRPIQNVTVKDDNNGEWNLHRGMNGRMLAMEGEPPTLRLFVATLGHGFPVSMLSCHDEGWEGYPADTSPYVAQGSRALIGYSCLFTPMIPIFFGGEEFNATYRPIPWLSPNLWGGGELGKGRWLYGNMLDWEDLEKPEHVAMLDDVKKMIAVRKQEAALLAIPPADQQPKLMAVQHECNIKAPVPYIRWNNRAAIVVAANRNEEKDAQINLKIPLTEIGMAGHAMYKVSNLFPGGESKTVSGKDLAALARTVKRDKTAGGGLLVLKIEPA